MTFSESTNTTTALITGANRGIGWATARRLLDLGWTVWLGARDYDLGEKAAAELEALRLPGRVRAIQLDVTADASVDAAAARVRSEGGLDVLINNAGIGGGRTGITDVADTTPTDFLPTFGVNLLGPVRVTRAFLSVLESSPAPRIVNISADAGSFAVAADADGSRSTPVDLVYPASKAALNMITVMTAKALPTFRVNAVDPGNAANDPGGNPDEPHPDDAATRILLAADVGPDGPTGVLFGADGPIDW